MADQAAVGHLEIADANTIAEQPNMLAEQSNMPVEQSNLNNNGANEKDNEKLNESGDISSEVDPDEMGLHRLSDVNKTTRIISSPHKENHQTMSPNYAEFGRIPKAPKNIVGNHRTMPSRNSSNFKHPNQMPLMKMSTVSMSTRQQTSAPSGVYYNNYVETRRPRKVITWDEAMNARPPLRIDMDGPTACSYTPRNKPLYETNSPAWSFGRRTFVEKGEGSRTSWQKTWFQSCDPWTQKADFHSDKKWPAPSTHHHKPTVGGRLHSLHAAPQYSFGFKRKDVLVKHGTQDEPAPNDYEIHRSDTIILPRSPAYSHSLRRGGTCLWSLTERTPGPGTYQPEMSYARVKTHHPSFSIRAIRREGAHQLGPFAAF